MYSGYEMMHLEMWFESLWSECVKNCSLLDMKSSLVKFKIVRKAHLCSTLSDPNLCCHQNNLNGDPMD